MHVFLNMIICYIFFVVRVIAYILYTYNLVSRGTNCQCESKALLNGWDHHHDPLKIPLFLRPYLFRGGRGHSVDLPPGSHKK